MKTYRLVKKISKGMARQILTPHLETIANAIEQAWVHWEELPADARKSASSRTRASYVYDFICDEIRARFQDVGGVSISETPHSMIFLNIEGSLVLRFKKLDRQKLGSNIATRFQTEFTAQLELPGLPPEAARLVVGYQLDQLQSKITDILVTYRIDDHVEWYFSLPRNGSVARPVPAELPFPATRVNKPRITAKKPGKVSKTLLNGTDQDDDQSREELRKTSDQ